MFFHDTKLVSIWYNLYTSIIRYTSIMEYTKVDGREIKILQMNGFEYSRMYRQIDVVPVTAPLTYRIKYATPFTL